MREVLIRELFDKFRFEQIHYGLVYGSDFDVYDVLSWIDARLDLCCWPMMSLAERDLVRGYVTCELSDIDHTITSDDSK